jgi:large repetitive protein
VGRLFRLMLATLLLALAPVLATPAQAASEYVEITSPADGSSGYGTDLTISGKARSGTNWVYVTVGSDINTYQAYIYKGRWSTHVNEQPAGPTTICAELRGTAGIVLARDCNAFTVTADPARLDIAFPEEGSVQGASVWVVALCVTGTMVRLTMDAGETVELPCEYWSVDRTYTGLAEGSHTVTASMVDQGVVVATRTRTFTVDLPDPGTVSISSPADGSSGYVGPVTVSGTASSWNHAVYLFTDGVESHIASIDEAGRWEVTLDSLAVGSHTICAAVKDPNFQVEAQDCITYTVEIDPSLLTINSPAEGSTSSSYVVVDGWCADGTTVSLSMDGGPPTEQPCFGSFGQEYSGLADGPHTVTVTMLYDGAAIVTRERSFTVDATPPAAPVITSPSTMTTITAPTLPLVGTAEPGSTVEVLTADELTSWSTSAADDGSWSLTLDSSFFELSGALSGHRTKMTVKVAATDAYGNRSAISSYTYTVRIH